MNLWFNMRQRVLAHKLAFSIAAAGLFIIIIITAIVLLLAGGAKNNQSFDPKKYVAWEFDGSEWSAKSTPPACPNPLDLNSPADTSTATNTIWPGQERGGNYKPHGGIRFDSLKSNSVTIAAPMDGHLFMAARYLVDGEVQYTLDFVHPCGIMYRLGHLRELSPKFATITDTLPPPIESSSAGHFVDTVFVPKGTQIATKVGFIITKNVFFDFGVYDLRQKNTSAQDPSWAATHMPEHAHNGVCWLELLPAEDSKILKSLPTGTEGRISDYCP